MGIKLMFFASGKTGLAAVCDVCGRHVTEAEEANVVWYPPPGGDKVGDTYEPHVVCKGACFRQFKAGVPKGGAASARLYGQELNAGLVWLLQNSGLMPLGGKKMKEAMRVADLLNSLP